MNSPSTPTQSEWYEGIVLAENIQFRFPECPKILPNSWHLIVPRGTQNGIQLMTDLLKWNPDQRPNSLQSMKYPLFAGANQSIEREREQRNLIANNEFESNFVTSSILSKDFVQKSASFNSLHKNLTQTSTLNIIRKEEEHRKSQEKLDNEKEKPEKPAKPQTKFTANFNVINELFRNFKQNSHDDTTNAHQDSITKSEHNGKSDISDQMKGSNNKREKVNDVYINLTKTNQDLFGEIPVKNPNSFFLHEPKVNNSMRTIRVNNELDASKSSLNFFEKPKKSFSDGDFANNIAKERAAPTKRDDEELATVLGSKMKSAKKATRENDINDLFGSISHHPSTVPVAKTTKFSNHLLRDIFDDSFDSTRSSVLNQRQSHSVLSDR